METSPGAVAMTLLARKGGAVRWCVIAMAVAAGCSTEVTPIATSCLSEAHPFRVTLNLNKDKGDNKPLFWGAHGQDKDDDGNWRDKWRVKVPSAPVPLDEWMTLSVSDVQSPAAATAVILRIRPFAVSAT